MLPPPGLYHPVLPYRTGEKPLNCQGAAQLNYHVLRQNVLDELHTPLAEPRTTRVTQSHTIQRQAKDYTLHTRPTHKDYRLVCSNLDIVV